MIGFPRTLQPIHIFEKDDVWYVTNLQVGEVLQIDVLTAEILELCSTEDNASILKKLEDRYSEWQILERLKDLSAVEDILFKPEMEPILSPTTAETETGLRIFILHSFMKYRETFSPNTNIEIYNLLIALARYAQVFVEIDNTPAAMEHQEQLMKHGIQCVSGIFGSADQPTYASNRFILDDCHGILALSPHPYEELNYYRHNTIPIVSRIYSDRNLREATINKLLSHQALRRNFDCICPDTPWITEDLALVKSFRPEGLETIPNGVDTEVYSPQTQKKAREVVASIVGEKSILDTPLVGILNGFEPQNSVGMITELARRHRDVVFIVLDPILERDRSQQHPNVFYITLQQPEDTAALPWIYNACEFVIFPTVIGTSFSMVLEVLACGVPGLALNTTRLPHDLAAGMMSVPLTRDDTTGGVMIPTAAISEQVATLLGNPEIREPLSREARQIALNYSWDRTAQSFVALFTALNEKKTENGILKRSAVAFSPYYDRAQNVVRTGATQLDGLFKNRVEEGLAQTLLSDHTPEEVRTVLRYLLRDADQADRVLSTLIP